MVIKEYFQLLFPWLGATLLILAVGSWTKWALFQKSWHRLAVLAVAAFITLTPVQGLSLADYCLSLNPNFSIGSLALVVVLLWPRLTGRPLLADRQLLVFCLWNIGVSLVLLLSYLGLLPFDLYALGYSFSVWFIAMALVTLAALWRWPPLALIFMASIAAFDLQLLPSPNFFDYLTDGWLLLMSLGLVIPWFMPTKDHLRMTEN
jgi:hypothetical protein